MSFVDLDGDLVAEDPSTRGFHTGEGIYETLLAEGERLSLALAHLARLRDSARTLGLPPPPTDQALLRRIRGVLHANGLGAGPTRVHLRLDPEHLLVRASAEGPGLAKRRSEGVAAIAVASDPRPPSRAHKFTARDALGDATARARAGGAEEALLFTPGAELLEGSTSNVFCVVDGRVLTPPADGRILPGVTRALAMRLGARTGSPPHEAPLTRADVDRASEVFLTSAVRLLVPVVEIEGRPVGGGRPGPVARVLGQALRSHAFPAGP